MLDDIEDVLDGRMRMAWIQRGAVAAYVRRSKRYLTPGAQDPVTCFDLANVWIEEEHEGKGEFKAFMKWLESLMDARGLPLYVESILNDRLMQMLLKHGYEPAREPQSLVRWPKEASDG